MPGINSPFINGTFRVINVLVSGIEGLGSRIFEGYESFTDLGALEIKGTSRSLVRLWLNGDDNSSPPLLDTKGSDHEWIINYKLDKPAQVQIHILDSHGQRIRTLESYQEKSGSINQAWDGMDSNGHTVKKGLYRYKIFAKRLALPILYFSQERPISKAVFMDQMQFLKENNFQTFTSKEAVDIIKTTGKVPEKGVVLAFDKGLEYFMEVYLPILQQLNLKATIFIDQELPTKIIRPPAQPLLLYGSTGELVKKLQIRLNDYRYNLVVDSIFGRRTERAVISYQVNKNLLVDGIVGPQTRGSLYGPEKIISRPVLTREEFQELKGKSGMEILMSEQPFKQLGRSEQSIIHTYQVLPDQAFHKLAIFSQTGDEVIMQGKIQVQ